MKKSLFLLSFVLVAAFQPAGAQSPDDSLHVGIGVSGGQGRSVVSITSREEGQMVCISLSGYEIMLGHEPGRRAVYTDRPRKKNYRGYLGVLEFGFNTLVSTDYSLYSPEEKGFMDLKSGRSVHFAWNILHLSKGLNRAGTLGVTMGLGIAWNDYVFSDNITIEPDGNRLIRPVELDKKYKKSKLNTFSLHIPVQLEASSGGFFVAGGLYGDLVLGSHTKIKKPKEKERSGNYVNFFKAGATARIGYKAVYVFGDYDLTYLFKHNRGPETHALSVGLGIGF